MQLNQLHPQVVLIKFSFQNIPILLQCSKQFLRSPLQPCILLNPQDVKFYSWSFCLTYLTYMTALTSHSSSLPTQPYSFFRRSSYSSAFLKRRWKVSIPLSFVISRSYTMDDRTMFCFTQLRTRPFIL